MVEVVGDKAKAGSVATRNENYLLRNVLEICRHRYIL